VTTPYDQIDHNLTNHAPADENVVTAMVTLRADAKFFGHTIVALCPDSREKSLALTNLEQTVMWAIAAIARNQGEVR